MANLVSPQPMVGLPGAAAKAEEAHRPPTNNASTEGFGLNIVEYPYFVLGINNEKGNANQTGNADNIAPWLGPWTKQPVVAPLS
ncbi:hypothetical protein AERO9A_210104 [Aeromonas salmonicida]|nr:hypothetical protein AERO9A_210104 [Aeromonas salmonicida]